MDNFDVIKLQTALTRIADAIQSHDMHMSDTLEDLTESVKYVGQEIRNLKAEIVALGDAYIAYQAPASKGSAT